MAMTRRVMVQRGLATAAMMTGTMRCEARKRLKFVVAGGHPGDPEYGCGGTVAKLTGLGHSVVLLYLNDGAWPPTAADVRIDEAKKACAALGAKPVWAGQRNGAAVVDAAAYASYGRIVEAEAPDAVLTHWPLDNHRDHRATAMLCFDAWIQSRRRYALYYFEVSDGEDTVQFTPNRWVDISRTREAKRTACFAHASQTPERYFALQDQVAASRGTERGVERAKALCGKRAARRMC